MFSIPVCKTHVFNICIKHVLNIKKIYMLNICLTHVKDILLLCDFNGLNCRPPVLCYTQYWLVCCRFSELTEPHIQILQTVAPRLSLSSLTSLAEVIVARIISCEKEDVMAANGRDR